MIPKREVKGVERRPARVVAPTSVKRGRSSRIERAAGPEQMDYMRDRFDRVPQLVDRKGAETPPQA